MKILFVVLRTSAEYSQPSRRKGTRLMALCDVALGRCYETRSHDTTITAPPNDYDSIHGVKASTGGPSDFTVRFKYVYRVWYYR